VECSDDDNNKQLASSSRLVLLWCSKEPKNPSQRLVLVTVPYRTAQYDVPGTGRL